MNKLHGHSSHGMAAVRIAVLTTCVAVGLSLAREPAPAGARVAGKASSDRSSNAETTATTQESLKDLTPEFVRHELDCMEPIPRDAGLRTPSRRARMLLQDEEAWEVEAAEAPPAFLEAPRLLVAVQTDYWRSLHQLNAALGSQQLPWGLLSTFR